MILIIDFGSQTTHLIGRRIRELGIEVNIIYPKDAVSSIGKFKPKGIILSGGPSSVYAENALLIDRKIFDYEIPILGICYGLQLIGFLLNGKVEPGKKKEYGPTFCKINPDNFLFSGLDSKQRVWMSHFDQVALPPKGFDVTGSTTEVKVAAVSDVKRKIFGIQFHPEVHHTPNGKKILSNFVVGICGEKPKKLQFDINSMIRDLKNKIGKRRAVCALSGGIDSSVAAFLAHKAIGKNLVCFYVDTGLMRLSETEEVIENMKDKLKLPLQVIRAKNDFLKVLKGVTDPEEKRRIIGKTFIRIFEKYTSEYLKINKVGKNEVVLLQGTIYPDVIESKGSAHADKIKTHHNVAGVPDNHMFEIVEPLRMLYKDEVREIAKTLKFPTDMIVRHVFPGPGLAVRIIGEVTQEKLDILRRADAIVVEEIKKSGLYKDIWMAFAVFTGVKSTGVTGDERKYGETIAIRAIESKDTMTADWVRLPYDVLSRISERIVTEVFEVVRVVYDITTKPPSTMEWE